MKPIKEFTVIYNKRNGSLTDKKFKTPKEAFEFFWKNRTGNPQITSDELMGGGFSFRDIMGFKTREEGKEFAYRDFLEYIKDFRK